MKLTDTHSHLYDTAFNADREEALARAAAAGVEHLLLPGIDSESHGALFDLCRRHPGQCVPMMGLHPTSVNDNPHWREELALAERYLTAPPEGIARFCAVGEIGLDYYWSGEFVAEQVEAFVSQCRLAARLGLPVAIHTRAAWDDMCRIVGEEAKAAAETGLRLRGVFHAFSEDTGTYRKLKACGDFAFGIGGVVTFRKSKLADTVREMELDDIVLETDCPYLTPAPHRGERNESAYVRFVCAESRGTEGLPPAKWRPQRRRTPNVFSEYNTIRPYDEIFDPDHLYGRYHRHEERCRNRRPGAFRLQRASTMNSLRSSGSTWTSTC